MEGFESKNIAVFVPGAIAPYRFMDIYDFTFNDDIKTLEFSYRPQLNTESKAVFTYAGFILEMVDNTLPAEVSDELDSEPVDIEIA